MASSQKLSAVNDEIPFVYSRIFSACQGLLMVRTQEIFVQ